MNPKEKIKAHFEGNKTHYYQQDTAATVMTLVSSFVLGLSLGLTPLGLLSGACLGLGTGILLNLVFTPSPILWAILTRNFNDYCNTCKKIVDALPEETAQDIFQNLEKE